MSSDYNSKKYEPYKIPERTVRTETEATVTHQIKSGLFVSPELQRFAQIEIGQIQNGNTSSGQVLNEQKLNKQTQNGKALNEQISNKQTLNKQIPNNQILTEQTLDWQIPNNQTLNELTINELTINELTINNHLTNSSTPKSETIVYTPQSVVPDTDEKRRLFASMRQLARDYPTPRINHSKYFNKPALLSDMSIVFYKQAEFIKDFEDDYQEHVAFTAYYPYYQIMNYAQLRVYFTWRTNVRKGVIKNVPLSYAYVYIYELLNNIGVDSPSDGLESLMALRRVFLPYNPTIDKYLLKWIKDYHIYYEAEKPFYNFIHENSLHAHYPEIPESEQENDSFQRLGKISKYDIKQSAFYTDDTHKLISDCFNFVIDSLNEKLKKKKLSLDDLIYQTNGKNVWIPFSKALFYPKQNQPDRRVVFSENEIYECRQNKWTYGSVQESGKQLTGYIMKQMESVLRRSANFKYKLTANSNVITLEHRRILNTAGIIPEQAITSAVLEFYAQINKKVITVDVNALEKIRQEALLTQEKLLVETVAEDSHIKSIEFELNEVNVSDNNTSVPDINKSPTPLSEALDEWAIFKQSLTETEFTALTVILQNGDIKKFSASNGVMVEVLIDGINQKAFDTINDNIIEFTDDVTVYEDYIEKLTEMVMDNG